MKKGLSEILCIVDRSGSMASIRSEAIGGFNAFLESQKQEAGEANLTLVLFDNEYKVVCRGTAIGKVQPLSDKTFVPRGTTALLDAMGRTIDDAGKRLADMPDEQRPETVIVAVLTDGMENASSDYSQAQIAEIIRHQKENYNWQFVFLAANQDAIATAERLSINRTDAMSFNSDSAGTRMAFRKMSCMVSERRTASKKGGVDN